MVSNYQLHQQLQFGQELKKYLNKIDFIEVETEWGIVKAKRGFSNDSVTKIVPEYEYCRRLAEANQVPLRTVYETVIQEIKLDENQSIDS